MKKIIFISIALVITYSCFSQAPNWAWERTSGGTSDDKGNSVATDASGNVYVTGNFMSPTITFGSTTLTNTSAGSYDIFLVKYDNNGNVIWAKSAGGIYDDQSNGITTDINGNIYITGGFNTSITFGSTTLTSPGVFVVKYDSSGNVVWANGYASPGSYGQNLVTDSTGNLYLIGNLGFQTITFGSTTLQNANDTVNGVYDIFVVKFDNNGNVVWVNRAGGEDFDFGYSIALDNSNNVYITGGYGSVAINFGSDTLVNVTTTLGVGNTDVFVTKYDNNGNVLWARTAGGDSNDDGFGISTDNNGNVFVTGASGCTPITFGSITLPAPGVGDIFIAKYDGNGNVIWAKGVGGPASDFSNSIKTDAVGNSYITGYFESSSLGFETDTIISNGLADVFFAKYDSNGNVLWARNVGGTGIDRGNSITIDGSENIYFTGYFQSPSITFGANTFLNDNTSFQDIYTVKLGAMTGIREENNPDNLNIFPNPFTSQTTLAFSTDQKNTEVRITDILGKEIRTLHFSGKELIIEKGEMERGIYFVEITDVNKNRVNRKIVVE